MKFFLFALILVSACCNSKSSTKSAVETAQTSTNIRDIPDTSLPNCISDMIAKFKTAPLRNPPVKIYSYSYMGKTVYYVNAECCDFFSDLCDSNCKLIGHPDGGFTGRGDGSVPNFKAEAKNEKLIWEDKRK